METSYGQQVAQEDGLPPNAAAKLLGVSVRTLRSWTAADKIKSFRTPGGHRRYTLAEVDRIRRGDAA